MAIRNALQFVSRLLARSRKGLGEQASSSGGGGSPAEPSTRETVRQCLIIYAVVRIYGPNGLVFQLIDERHKDAKEATDLPK